MLIGIATTALIGDLRRERDSASAIPQKRSHHEFGCVTAETNVKGSTRCGLPRGRATPHSQLERQTLGRLTVREWQPQSPQPQAA
jgi:hypothetical protein